MSNRYIIYNFRAEIQGDGTKAKSEVINWQLIMLVKAAQLSQRGRAMLRVFVNIAVTQNHSNLHPW